MPLPDIKGPARNKPLCFDPKRHKFITFDELVSGQEKIVPLETLSPADLNNLVIERNRVGPDYTVRSLTGETYRRDDVIRAIEQQSDFGRLTVEAETSHLSDLLKQIRDNLA
jgi:hypothetical protein